jgi:hypothetical protein
MIKMELWGTANTTVGHTQRAADPGRIGSHKRQVPPHQFPVDLLERGSGRQRVAQSVKTARLLENRQRTRRRDTVVVAVGLMIATHTHSSDHLDALAAACSTTYQLLKQAERARELLARDEQVGEQFLSMGSIPA